MWATISTVAVILTLGLGVARYIAARRKARVDRELGEARAEKDALRKGEAAGRDRVDTDVQVDQLSDTALDDELAGWMRGKDDSR